MKSSYSFLNKFFPGYIVSFSSKVVNEKFKINKGEQKIKKILILICISLFLFTSFYCNITGSNFTDYHNKILFTSSRSGKDQLYMMNPDGTDIVQITSGQYFHNYGRWSPSAQMIVCNTEEKITSESIEMAVINSDGSYRKLLGIGYFMKWYPDGSEIIYFGGYYNAKVYSIEPSGNNRKIVTDKYGASYTLSPDGKNIAFIEPDSNKIVILDYPNLENPLYVGPIGCGFPEWSPNNNEIAFSHKDMDINYEIYVVNIIMNITRRITSHSSNEHYYSPNWSPDGKKIIFLAISLDGTEKSYLYLVNIDGTDLHKIIDDDSITSCDWSK